jgi:flagellar hook-associated protein 3 FlgL
MANDAVKIEDPTVNFYKELGDMVTAVRNGDFQMDGQSDNPRSIGLNNSLNKITHLMDHIEKKHTQVGSYSNALSNANERSTLLSVNVQTIRSQVIDVDIGQAYMKFNQISNSYQAMLSTVAKINSMSLLKYM